jgi:hypothetical protein
MLYKTEVAVCSDIYPNTQTQCERHVEFFNFKTGGA